MIGCPFDEDELGGYRYEVPLLEFPYMLDTDVDIVPDPMDLSVVQEQVTGFKECDHDRLALYAAVACLYPTCKERGGLMIMKNSYKHVTRFLIIGWFLKS